MAATKGVDATEYLLENWIDATRELTFPTIILPLTNAEAHALLLARELARMEHYRSTHADAQSLDLNELATRAKFSEGVLLAMGAATTGYAIPKTLPAHVRAALASIEQKLHEHISRERPAVVKLTARSPKDALLCRPEFQAVLQEAWRTSADELDALLPAESSALPVSREEIVHRIALTRAAGKLMRVDSASSAIALLLDSSRVFADVSASFVLCGLDHGAVAEAEGRIDWADTRRFGLSLVVREFEPRLDPLLEFRAFVQDGVLRGVTQYDPYSMIPQVWRAADRDRICDLVRGFIEQRVMPPCADTLRLRDYTVDVGMESGAGGQLWMIEINNPPPIAGAALFGQKIDGEEWPEWSLSAGPFEFRVYSEARAASLGRIWGLMDVVPPDVVAMMQAWEQQRVAERTQAPRSWLSRVFGALF